jgi:hypothetical protein
MKLVSLRTSSAHQPAESAIEGVVSDMGVAHPPRSTPLIQ